MKQQTDVPLLMSPAEKGNEVSEQHMLLLSGQEGAHDMKYACSEMGYSPFHMYVSQPSHSVRMNL